MERRNITKSSQEALNAHTSEYTGGNGGEGGVQSNLCVYKFSSFLLTLPPPTPPRKLLMKYQFT